MAELSCQYGRVSLGNTNVTIGRRPGNSLVIPHGSVSSFHAEIRPVGEGNYAVFDMNSANGVFINGERIAPSSGQILKDGDVITCGFATVNFSNPRTVFELVASIVPLEQTISGKQNTAKFEVIVTNHINQQLTFRMRGESLGQDELDFSFTAGYSNTTLSPGEQLRIPITVAVRNRPFFGRKVTYHFQILVITPYGEPIKVPAQLISKPLLGI